jgi:hypothetical protein
MVDVAKVEDSMEVEFKEPMPKLDYTTEITNSISMLQNGLSYREKEIKRLHPYATDDEINQIFFEYGESRHEIGSSEVEEAVEPSNEEEEDTNTDQMESESENEENEDQMMMEDDQDQTEE